MPSEYSDNEPVYDEGLLPDTEEGHSSPVYDQVPERDEYIDNKTMMLAKVDSQQVRRPRTLPTLVLLSPYTCPVPPSFKPFHLHSKGHSGFLFCIPKLMNSNISISHSQFCLCHMIGHLNKVTLLFFPTNHLIPIAISTYKHWLVL